jgi:hypothetical protein
MLALLQAARDYRSEDNHDAMVCMEHFADVADVGAWRAGRIAAILEGGTGSREATRALESAVGLISADRGGHAPSPAARRRTCCSP